MTLMSDIDIFVLDDDLETSVQFHGNRQVLTAGFHTYKILYAIAEGQVLDNPWYHWAKASKHNHNWLVRYGAAMVAEYAHRYPKFTPLYNLMNRLPIPNLPDIPQQPFPQVMPEIYKHEDVVEAYRNFFVFEREDSMRWLNRDKPYWV